MSTRENVEDKGRRYLIEGRVLVERVDQDEVLATVRGGGDLYRVTHQRGGWECSCPARTRCAHLVAVGLVTAPGARLAVPA
jgi:uncharacterized Zn finger protein